MPKECAPIKATTWSRQIMYKYQMSVRLLVIMQYVKNTSRKCPYQMTLTPTRAEARVQYKRGALIKSMNIGLSLCSKFIIWLLKSKKEKLKHQTERKCGLFFELNSWILIMPPFWTRLIEKISVNKEKNRKTSAPTTLLLRLWSWKLTENRQTCLLSPWLRWESGAAPLFQLQSCRCRCYCRKK